MGGRQDEGGAEAGTLALVMELLCFCVARHNMRIKYFVLRNHCLEATQKLFKRREAWLGVAAVRFMRTCIGLKVRCPALSPTASLRRNWSRLCSSPSHVFITPHAPAASNSQEIVQSATAKRVSPSRCGCHVCTAREIKSSLADGAPNPISRLVMAWVEGECAGRVLPPLPHPLEPPGADRGRLHRQRAPLQPAEQVPAGRQSTLPIEPCSDRKPAEHRAIIYLNSSVTVESNSVAT